MICFTVITAAEDVDEDAARVVCVPDDAVEVLCGADEEGSDRADALGLHGDLQQRGGVCAVPLRAAGEDREADGGVEQRHGAGHKAGSFL